MINRAHNFPADFPSPEAGIGLLSMLFSHPAFYCIVADVEKALSVKSELNYAIIAKFRAAGIEFP